MLWTSPYLPALFVGAGTAMTFGISGYLYDSDVLLYDHQTETFWQQLTGRAVVYCYPWTGRPGLPNPWYGSSCTAR